MVQGLDMTTSVVTCLILKLCMVLDKFEGKRLDKNINFCTPLNHIITMSQIQIIKNTKITFCRKNIEQDIKLSNTLKVCHVLFYFVLY